MYNIIKRLSTNFKKHNRLISLNRLGWFSGCLIYNYTGLMSPYIEHHFTWTLYKTYIKYPLTQLNLVEIYYSNRGTWNDIFDGFCCAITITERQVDVESVPGVVVGVVVGVVKEEWWAPEAGGIRRHRESIVPFMKKVWFYDDRLVRNQSSFVRNIFVSCEFVDKIHNSGEHGLAVTYDASSLEYFF